MITQNDFSATIEGKLKLSKEDALKIDKAIKKALKDYSGTDEEVTRLILDTYENGSERILLVPNKVEMELAKLGEALLSGYSAGLSYRQKFKEAVEQRKKKLETK